MAAVGELKRAEALLSKAALAYPGAYEEHPWGHRAMKVKGKAYVFFSLETDHFSLSIKLPKSSAAAVMLPFASPTGYGLGKSGWVTAQFKGSQKIPTDLLLEWIDESYRAIAPKSIVKTLAAPGATLPATATAKPRAAKGGAKRAAKGGSKRAATSGAKRAAKGGAKRAAKGGSKRVAKRAATSGKKATVRRKA